MSDEARIFTRQELERALRKYAQSGMPMARVDRVAGFIYDHYGIETDISMLKEDKE